MTYTPTPSSCHTHFWRALVLSLLLLGSLLFWTPQTQAASSLDALEDSTPFEQDKPLNPRYYAVQPGQSLDDVVADIAQSDLQGNDSPQIRALLAEFLIRTNPDAFIANNPQYLKPDAVLWVPNLDEIYKGPQSTKQIVAENSTGAYQWLVSLSMGAGGLLNAISNMSATAADWFTGQPIAAGMLLLGCSIVVILVVLSFLRIYWAKNRQRAQRARANLLKLKQALQDSSQSSSASEQAQRELDELSSLVNRWIKSDRRNKFSESSDPKAPPSS